MHKPATRPGPRAQLLRFVAVGVASNALGYGLYLLVTWAGMPPKVAMSLMYAIGVGSGFIGNWRYAFANRAGLRHALPRYLAAHLLGYLVNLGIHLLGDRFGAPHQLSQAVGICVVAAILFLLFRYFVFSEPARTAYR